MKKTLISVLLVIVLIVGGIFSYIMLSWDKAYDVPYPDYKASNDSALIARGKYLVYGPGHCAYCHMPSEKLQDVASGEEVPLSGGWEFNIPPGSFRAPNLTADVETGIGALSDGEIARALRYSLTHEGKVMVPVMPFQNMSDEDIIAIISFLRTQEAVYNVIPPSEFTFLGKALLTFGMFKPVYPTGTPPAKVASDSTASYGSYLANSVANCVGCHTDRDLKTGAYINPLYSGGFLMPAEGDPEMEGYMFISPNITPDPESGIIAAWDEQTFIERFQYGRLQPGSPMPWEAYATMTELDLKAVFRYLNTLEPVKSNITQTVFEPGEAIPEK